MRVEFKKKYLDEYDLKKVVRAVNNLFDDYYYKKAVAQDYLESFQKHRIMNENVSAKNHRKTDLTYNIVEKREEVVSYLHEFDKKIENLLINLSDDEIKIYKYSILAREQDKVIRDKICKTDKTYYLIKKSCYVKFALRFNLVDGFTKDIFATISLYD